MPIFEYKAINATGKNSKGIVEAESIKAARIKLKKQSLMVTEITEKSALKPTTNSQGIPFIGNRITQKDVSMLTRQLASLVKANIPLVEALSALVEQTELQPLKIIINKVRDDVNEGLSLAKSLAMHPKTFDNIFINMVDAGESSGTLGLVLLKLADLKEAQMRLRSKVISGMTYPALMAAVAAVLVLGIFTFVIPKMAKIFESMGKPIPDMTKFLMVISAIMVDYWYVIFAVFGGVVFFFQRWINSPKGRPEWDSMKLKAPLFGPLLRMIALTRFASTMSTLLASGVPIITSMTISRNLVGNVKIAEAIENAKNNITEGQSIAEPLKRSGEFPPLVIHMISIGEKTGELPDMLRNIAETYEEQVNSRIEGMTALIEPGMIVVMGGVVGFVVMSIMMPLLDAGNLGK
ncbi:MAG: type II secretion system inner membrane protein GspF [Xanthomonadaceae bacterium]|nr:type II secretion system inner membrane protein GspF [Xanthomonadaceae bacterium]